MSEFELHQLILASRAEFDIATAIMLATSLGFIVIAQLRTAKWSVYARVMVIVTYVVASEIIVIRTIVSIVRFAKLNALLEAGDRAFIVTNLSLQLPTVALRLALFVSLFLVTVYFLYRQGKTA